MSDVTVNQTPNAEAPTTDTVTSKPGIVDWARKIGEDWWSVLLALVLLTLIVSRLLTAIP